MISSLRGSVLHLGSDSVVVDVGGVGFSVAVTPDIPRTYHVGDEIVLHTNLVVREDSLSLFGFESRDQLGVFLLLIGVTGVGPKSALGVLASLSVEQVAEAVTTEDDAPFRRVSGIGPKTAKLIVVQLAGKLAAPVVGASAPAAGADRSLAGQVIAALVALGWSERVAADAVSQVVAAGDAPGTVPALLKLALAHLGPARSERSGG
ncbi:Holliday junction branch migration protein RuvA [Microbacterium radiodurans]|uniref:Holliday junction branch migration complex subunit RuvA n=1 Tax=Microbacterium radiodurans TaxID=661398 RepID=A0A5J5IUG7_9MICO|nr:Holliday junction branch migration protein RuvA [Microbacterium radiodurans]KAA9087017.1 Holliday junction branch migration protein RuvA [Microbacterium radiodurans]